MWRYAIWHHSQVTGAWRHCPSVRASWVFVSSPCALFTWLSKFPSSLLCPNTRKCSQPGHYSCRERGHFSPPAAFLCAALPGSTGFRSSSPCRDLRSSCFLGCPTLAPVGSWLEQAGLTLLAAPAPLAPGTTASWWPHPPSPDPTRRKTSFSFLFFFGRHPFLAVVLKVWPQTYSILSSGNLGKRQMLRPQPRPSESESAFQQAPRRSTLTGNFD